MPQLTASIHRSQQCSGRLTRFPLQFKGVYALNACFFFLNRMLDRGLLFQHIQVYFRKYAQHDRIDSNYAVPCALIRLVLKLQDKEKER